MQTRSNQAGFFICADTMTYITRSPARCIGCGASQKKPHEHGCAYGRFTIRSNAS